MPGISYLIQSKRSIFRRWWLIAAISISIFLFATIVPPNMDEALQYKHLVCYFFPNASENVFREGCGNGCYDLKIFGKFLPLRSFGYLGFTSSLFYLPMYLIWPYYLSARVMGILALLIITYVIHRLSRTPLWLSGLIVLFSFPVVFQCITDRGPVIYQMALMFVLLYLMTRPINPLRGVLIGLIVFVCIEQKPFFINFIPAVIIVAFYLLKPVFDAGDKAARLSMLKSLLIAMVVAAVPTFILFTAETRYDCRYYDELLRLKGASPLDFSIQIQDLKKNLIPYFVDFSSFANSQYNVKGMVDKLTVSIWTSFLAIIVIGQVYARCISGSRHSTLLISSLGAFLLSLYIINMSPHVQKGHHYVIAFPFLLLGIAVSVGYIYRYRRALAVFLVIIVAVLNIAVAYKTVQLPINEDNDRSKVKVLDYMRQDDISSRYVYVFPDWGIYCLFALYGSKKQIALYIEPVNNADISADIATVESIAQGKDRKQLIIAKRSTFANSKLINAYYPTLKLITYPGYSDNDAWIIKAQWDKNNKAMYDFDGKGKSDILWRSTTTGDVVIWLMNGKEIKGRDSVVKGLPSDWLIKGIGDFNGDGKADVLFQNNNGDVFIWLMDGAKITVGDYVQHGLARDWVFKAIGDFNGDGKSDILWQNSTTGDVAIWLMDGTRINGGGIVMKALPSDWTVKAAADFNNDGKSDLLWQNTNGNVYVWIMDGVKIQQGSGLVDKGIPSKCQIKAVDDFDGDGKADILWQDTITGDTAAWLMDGVKITGGNYVTHAIPSNWKLLTTGDYNGDGKNDILWQDSVTGDVVVWFMNGLKVSGRDYVMRGMSLDWQIGYNGYQ
ncbi:conserved hypothetical protein, membrane [Candidatus Magnetobacterium bavaricum]|uniref:FG-GAP repeat-containing protein n=1 Tax=Candidatus Magnetobacterium bavaricum TaxID=29290 RepID=A0A0F3GM01_9BACT|nr:conserved hypothetical protein, membrane [Candidatus Magnetobacterium bavaricum]